MNLFPTQGFEAAGRAALAHLHHRLGFGLWMITRTQGQDWIVLQSDDHGYGVAPGEVFPWADSFCSQMVRGNGPRIAPDSDIVPAYAVAPIGQRVPIKAYIGVPLTGADGSLFGTLCAIDPAPQPNAITGEQELVELVASMLSTILAAELNLADEVRRAERLQVQAHVDPLTQLSNRRAWDQLLAKEEERCRRYGHPAAVLAVDLDALKGVNDSAGHAAGDALIVRAAQALREVAREIDTVARLGGDEFGMIVVECDNTGADVVLERIREAFARHQVQASVGMAMRSPAMGLALAWQEADARMYANKRAK